jgi:hypothetical protein
MQACQGSGYTPKYVTHEEQRQSIAEDPYPNGYVFIIVMTKLEGWRLFRKGGLRTPLPLTPDDMRIIRKQIVDAMEFVFPSKTG